jgi:hypothetical protein
MEWRVSASSLDRLWDTVVTRGSTWCAPNVHADAAFLDAGTARWRVSTTRPVPRNCYVVSATGQYLDYAMEETRRIPSRVRRAIAVSAALPLRPILHALDPVVMLDALPLSTVLHAERSVSDWRDVIACARTRYRGMPLIVRSLDAVANPALLESLRAIGMATIPSRLVFHQDPRTEGFWRIRNVRHDLALSRMQPLHTRPLRRDDAVLIADLYWRLYGEKHSRLNPAFSVAFLEHAMALGALHGEGLEYEGRLVAVFLAYAVGDVLTNPVFGYDTSLPQSLGLYRRLSVLTMQYARERGLRLHASSGAPGFKASRGGVPAIEYHAVDLASVRGFQRAAWMSALAIANRIGPSVLRSAT